MQFISDIIISFFSAYLALTNTMADKIIKLLPAEETISTAEFTSPTTEKLDSLSLLPSIFEKGKLPDILLRSSDYQKAAAIEAELEAGTFVTDPNLALVNIFCTFTGETTIRTTTGTGFFVSDRGVIITNAHVAQYLLLGATNVLGDAKCIVRTGSPAAPEYLAKLLYIPPAWIQENATTINDEVPMGTGERDYALLYIAASLNGEPLPESFPALAVKAELLPRSITGSEVMAAGYPATDLLLNGPNTPLLAVSEATKVSELYTFGSNYADVFSIRGSKVGAEGSSGGPIINSKGEAIGMIVTRGDDSTDGLGSLRAITLSYIHRTILEETGFSLEKNINGDPSLRSKVFTETLAPFLTTVLSQELSN